MKSVETKEFYTECIRFRRNKLIALRCVRPCAKQKILVPSVRSDCLACELSTPWIHEYLKKRGPERKHCFCGSSGRAPSQTVRKIILTAFQNYRLGVETSSAGKTRSVRVRERSGSIHVFGFKQTNLQVKSAFPVFTSLVGCTSLSCNFLVV